MTRINAGLIYEGAEVRRRIMTLPCNRCGVRPGEECVTKSGRRATHWHALRWYAAVRAGLVPVMHVDGESS